jgi:hypothetical protein
MGVRHPSVYRLIEILREIEAANERIIAQLLIDSAPKTRKVKYVAADEAIN